MTSIYHVLFFPAFANGLFLAIITKTGFDITPAGIGLRVFDILQPYVNEQNIMIFRFAEIILLILPWIFLVVIVKKFGIRGLIIFGIITFGSYGFFLFFWK